MLLFDRNNETRIFFGPEKKFPKIYRQFRFWGLNLFFQLFTRTFISLSILRQKLTDFNNFHF